MKKFISLLLAVIMTFSCATICFAQDVEAQEKHYTQEVDYGNLTWIAELPFWTENTNSGIAKIMYPICNVFVTIFTIFGLTDEATAEAVREVMKNGPVEHTVIWTVTKEASCVDDGLKTAMCTACGYTDEEILPAFGHNYELTVIEPTVTDSGYTLHICTNCEDSYKTDEKFMVSSGAIVALRDVSEKSHKLEITLSSDTLADFSDVTVRKYGKNLLNPNDFSAYGSGISNIKFENDTISYNKEAGDAVGGISTVVYLPTGTYSLNYIAGGSVSTPCTLIESEDGQTEIYRGYETPKGGTTFEITNAGNYRILIYGAYSSASQQANTVSNLQLEAGEVSGYTPYTAYQQAKATADGKVTELDSLFPNVTLIADSDVCVSCIYRKSDMFADSDYLMPGDVKVIGNTLLKKNKTVSFSGDIVSFDKLRISHSDNSFGSTYVEITNSSIDVYYCYSSFEKLKSIEHNLTIKDDISVTLSVNELAKMSITLTSSGETFTKENLSVFDGRGNIKAESINSYLSNIAFDWNSPDFTKDIWVMGDSYVSVDSSRWPYHLLTDKDNFALFGYSGGISPDLFKDFENSLQIAKPEYAVWCLGMNEPDKNGVLNEQWKLYVEKFIALCEENGITPILATIPNVPDRNHTLKNEYVKNSGYRYIDFAAAVGANEVGSLWYDGMLHTDNVHPTSLGAEALAQQVLKDVPELN